MTGTGYKRGARAAAAALATATLMFTAACDPARGGGELFGTPSVVDPGYCTDGLGAPVPGNVGKYSSIIVDQADTAHIAYFDSCFGDLKYANVSAEGEVNVYVVDDGLDSIPAPATDGEPQMQVQAGDVGRYTSIDFNSWGDLVIGYYDATAQNFRVAFVRTNGEVISIEHAPPDAADVGSYLDLAVGAGDEVQLCYFDATNQAVVWAFFNGIDWFFEHVDGFPTTSTAPGGQLEGGSGAYCSIALNPDGWARVAYYDISYGDLRIAYRDAPDLWQRLTIDGAGVNSGKWVDLALSSLPNPDDPLARLEIAHLAYYDQTRADLRYAWGSIAGGFNISLVDGGGADNLAGSDISMVLNHRGLPRIAYLDGSHIDLRLASWDGYRWYYDILDGQGNRGFWPALGLRPSGDLAVSYYDRDLGNLMYLSILERY